MSKKANSRNSWCCFG